MDALQGRTQPSSTHESLLTFPNATSRKTNNRCCRKVGGCFLCFNYLNALAGQPCWAVFEEGGASPRHPMQTSSCCGENSSCSASREEVMRVVASPAGAALWSRAGRRWEVHRALKGAAATSSRATGNWAKRHSTLNHSSFLPGFSRWGAAECCSAPWESTNKRPLYPITTSPCLWFDHSLLTWVGVSSRWDSSEA